MHTYIDKISEVDGNESEVTGRKISNSNKSKFVTFDNDKFSISKIEVQAVPPKRVKENCIFVVW